ncbi:MAG: response regulator transcription factor [Candidatus Rokubacteria bacterium]|nr:response regulator transcription factor [Candidatus Rokubacteria bacterium]
MTGTPSVVFVVDDDRSVREGVKRLLESREIQAETFATAEAFLACPRPDAPACLVLDIQLPGAGGLDLQHALNRSARTLPIIFITGHGDVPRSVQAMKAGAVEFLTKPFRSERLLDAVRDALACDRADREARAAQDALRARVTSLTRRERDVMDLLVSGLLNKQVATRLGIAEITVKVRRAAVMRKMRAPSLVDLARMVDRAGAPPRGRT